MVNFVEGRNPAKPRHAFYVRASHWLTTLAFLALLLSGGEILLSHPRFYWGEAGNAGSRPLFRLPLPASRATVPTGYGYVLPDQNGWSRSLHFQSAWLLVLTGLVYLGFGLGNGHFRRDLLPAHGDRSVRAWALSLRRHLRFPRPTADEAWSYNLMQRVTYLKVIFLLFPLVIWTGLAMSPAVASAVPFAVTVWGGQQSARTLHFFATISLVAFLAIHLVMVVRAGFRERVRAMWTGRAVPAKDKEQA